MDKKTKKIYSIKGTLIPPSPIHVVPGEVEFITQEDTSYKEILCNVCEEPVRAYTPTDYACLKCHPEKFNGIEKDKFYRRFLTHEEQMVGAELFQKSFVGFQKEEPKPECDHVIKISAGGSEFCELSKIHTSGKETYCDESGYQGTVIYYPVCCPECGEKLNLKKDE